MTQVIEHVTGDYQSMIFPTELNCPASHRQTSFIVCNVWKIEHLPLLIILVLVSPVQ